MSRRASAEKSLSMRCWYRVELVDWGKGGGGGRMEIHVHVHDNRAAPTHETPCIYIAH